MSLIILGQKRGRPRTEDPRAVPASTRLTEAEFDRLAKMALARQTSMSGLIRHLLLPSLFRREKP